MILPLLLVLLLTVADFGRIFSAGIVIESAARAAAEVAAAEYLTEANRVIPPNPIGAVGYAAIHRAAWLSVCDEASSLPNASSGSGGSQCAGLPTVVCVHDNTDPNCSTMYNAAGGVPSGCATLSGPPPTNLQVAESTGQKWAYVEVRVCYRFSSVLRMDIPFIGGTLSPLGGDFFIEKSRIFTVANY